MVAPEEYKETIVDSSSESGSGWVKKLQKRWSVSANQVFIILAVFACTGFTVMFLKEPVLTLIKPAEDRNWIFSLIYYLLVLPFYNLLLLIYGFIFGQFSFFWNFEKRFFSRMAKKIRNN